MVCYELAPLERNHGELECWGIVVANSSASLTQVSIISGGKPQLEKCLPKIGL